jgi:DNA polymerase-3 subunit epsilon
MISLEQDNFIECIPNTCGVYLFYGISTDFPLYIGKSINIRQRIKSHFQLAKINKRSEKLITTARYIDWQLTTGELGALLLESILIKEKFPIINRKLRRAKKIFSYRLIQNFDQVTLLLEQHNPENLWLSPHSYGLFRSQRSAIEMFETLIAQNKLCKKILSLEKAPSSCFAYQIKRCLGACIGKEDIRIHNKRLLDILQHYQNKVWPFPGLIGIIEQSLTTGYQEIYLINHWCYVGKTEYNNNVKVDFSKLKLNKQFDLDIYKILVSAIYKKNKALRIVEFEELSNIKNTIS